ncbi:MAG: RNA-binding protein [Candidatus Cloacimonetes bacterium]|nr:RNA-binding protein [Candidatus Cloacimonadota bacterium]
MNIFVGNMTREVTKEGLRDVFQEFGTVESVTILIDRINGVWKAFGFIEMPNENEAKQAINNIDGREFLSQYLSVHEARFRSIDRRFSYRQGGRRHTDLPELKKEK